MNAKLLVLFSVVVTVTYVSAVSNKERLLGDLLRGYRREVDPGTTPLRLGLSYLCADLNPNTNQLNSKLLEKYYWEDVRLKWNPAHYEGLEYLRVPANIIWTPDVKLYNTEWEAEVRDDVNAVLFSNGSAIWIPMVTYKTRCSTNQDEEGVASCKIKIGSWTYDANNLDLQLDGTGFDTFMYLDTCPYVISEAEVKVERKVYPCCPDPYASLDASFKVTARQ